MISWSRKRRARTANRLIFPGTCPRYRRGSGHPPCPDLPSWRLIAARGIPAALGAPEAAPAEQPHRSGEPLRRAVKPTRQAVKAAQPFLPEAPRGLRAAADEPCSWHVPGLPGAALMTRGQTRPREVRADGFTTQPRKPGWLLITSHHRLHLAKCPRARSLKYSGWVKGEAAIFGFHKRGRRLVESAGTRSGAQLLGTHEKGFTTRQTEADRAHLGGFAAQGSGNESAESRGTSRH